MGSHLFSLCDAQGVRFLHVQGGNDYRVFLKRSLGGFGGEIRVNTEHAANRTKIPDKSPLLFLFLWAVAEKAGAEVSPDPQDVYSE